MDPQISTDGHHGMWAALTAWAGTAGLWFKTHTGAMKGLKARVHKIELAQAALATKEDIEGLGDRIFKRLDERMDSVTERLDKHIDSGK